VARLAERGLDVREDRLSILGVCNSALDQLVELGPGKRKLLGGLDPAQARPVNGAFPKAGAGVLKASLPGPADPQERRVIVSIVSCDGERPRLALDLRRFFPQTTLGAHARRLG